jgi:DNA repair protein RadC
MRGSTDILILELLLTYAIPRVDVKPLAAELLSRFGTLSGVLEADYETLCTVSGVGEHCATLIKLVPALSDAYSFSKSHRVIIPADTPEQLKALLLPRFINEKTEIFFIACLDEEHNLIKIIRHSKGTTSSAPIDSRRLIAEAKSVGSCAVAFAHNHLSGSLTPSVEDISSTTKLVDLFEKSGIRVLDHFIISEDKIVSIFHQIKK